MPWTATGRMYDTQRFLESARRRASSDVSGWLKELYRGILDFSAGAELTDDVTMLALRRHNR